MTPNRWVTKLYEGWRQHGYTLYLFGDSNQCSPVQGGSAIHYDYLISVSAREMCTEGKELGTSQHHAGTAKQQIKS